MVKELPDSTSEAVSKCIKSVEDCVLKIETILQEINQIILQHQEKWFAYYRTPDHDTTSKKLRAQKSILTQRIDLLIKVMAINSEAHVHPIVTIPNSV